MRCLRGEEGREGVALQSLEWSECDILRTPSPSLYITGTFSSVSSERRVRVRVRVESLFLYLAASHCSQPNHSRGTIKSTVTTSVHEPARFDRNTKTMRDDQTQPTSLSLASFFRSGRFGRWNVVWLALASHTQATTVVRRKRGGSGSPPICFFFPRQPPTQHQSIENHRTANPRPRIIQSINSRKKTETHTW
jgi:hypothetical protein